MVANKAEEAVVRLEQCIAVLLPSLLDRIAALRSAHPSATLLPPNAVFADLAPLAAQQSVKEAFAIPPPPPSPSQRDATSKAQPSAEEQAQLRLRNLCLEVGANLVRAAVLEVASQPSDAPDSAVLTDGQLRTLIDRLDAVLALSLSGAVDTALPLTLVEELLELHTVHTCSLLFAYVESRVKQLTIDLHPMRGKGLVLLRLCNELLRRLSKPSQKHTVFAGRILSLLAAVFPLGERSGVNLRGDFNVDNRTVLEHPSQTDADGQQQGEASGAGGDQDEDDDDENGAALKPDAQMYELFWNMQHFFSNPPLLMGLQDGSRQSSRTATPAPAPASAPAGGDEPSTSDDDPAPDGAKGPMAELRIGTKKILALFAAVAKREKALAGAAANEGNAKSDAASVNGAANGKAANGSAAQKQAHITGYKAGRDTALVDDGSGSGSESQGRGDASRKRKRYEPDIKDGVRVHRALKPEDGGDDDVEMSGDGSDPADVDNNDDDADPTRETDNFFPKFLTGRKLLEYEIRDASFRRHILVQYLILFQYLLSFTPAAREKWKEWKNRNLQGLFVLDEADEQWMRKAWREVLALLRDIPPNGRVFVEALLEVLRREANWIRWKTEMCPSIEKPPLTPQQLAAFAEARAQLLKPKDSWPHALGTAALSELWAEGFPPPVAGTRRVENEEGVYVDVATDGLEELEFLPPVPTLAHYHSLIKREEMKLQMRRRQLGVDPSAPLPEDAEKEERDPKCQSICETMQSLAWRALRVASGQHLHLFKAMKGAENIPALMAAIEEERNPKPKPAAVAVEVKVEPPSEDNEAAGKGSEGEPHPVAKLGEGAAPGSTAAAGSAGEDRKAAAEVPVAVPEVPRSPAPTTARSGEADAETAATPGEAKEAEIEKQGDAANSEETKAGEGNEEEKESSRTTVAEPRADDEAAEAPSTAAQEEDVEMADGAAQP